MDLAAFAQPISDAIQSLRDLPWLAHALVGVAFVAGLVLWIAGRAIVKPVMVVLLVLAGAAAGLFLLPVTPWKDAVSPYMAAGIGAGAGAVVGLLVYRVAMAVGLGVVLMVLTPLVAHVAMGPWAAESEPAAALTAGEQMLDGVAVEGDEEDVRERAERMLGSAEAYVKDLQERERARQENGGDAQDAEGADGAGAAGLSGDAEAAGVNEILDRPEVKEAVERLRRFALAAGEEATLAWERVPVSRRLTYTGCGLGGLVLGVLVGLVLPKWGAGAATAMLGAGVVLASFAWLAESFELPWVSGGALTRTPAQWMLIWGVMTVIGVAVQWSGLASKVAKRKGRARRDDDDDEG